MPTGFHATDVSVVQQDGVLITSMGTPSTEDEGLYLILQHTPEFDEQDVALGMDKPYIEYCSQAWSWYGHMFSVHLLRDRVEIQMDEHAASEMGNGGDLVITFSLDDQEFQNLKSALASTFAGQSYFTSRA